MRCRETHKWFKSGSIVRSFRVIVLPRVLHKRIGVSDRVIDVLTSKPNSLSESSLKLCQSNLLKFFVGTDWLALP